MEPRRFGRVVGTLNRAHIAHGYYAFHARATLHTSHLSGLLGEVEIVGNSERGENAARLCRARNDQPAQFIG
ncbi:hypothetical protein D3C85_1417310 [compost metagenome]